MIILLPFDRADSVDTFRAQNDCFNPWITDSIINAIERKHELKNDYYFLD